MNHGITIFVKAPVISVSGKKVWVVVKSFTACILYHNSKKSQKGIIMEKEGSSAKSA